MKVVYVTHNDVGSALVRSQVLPYLRLLATRGVDAHLITFERAPSAPPDLDSGRWHRIRANPGSGLLAKLQDVVVGLGVLLLVLVRHGGFVHARSYLPAAIGWLAGGLLRRPYIFDMRGFLPDEYLEGGHWRIGDLRYRVLRIAERRLLRDAAAIVVLTHRASDRLRREKRFVDVVGTKPVVVIPCAVDLERFRPARTRDERPTLVYAGSVGMWYDLDAMFRVFAAGLAALPGLRFLILNQGQHESIANAAARHGLAGATAIKAASFDQMPGLLGAAHVGICVLRQASSKSGSSPIKVAEYLACGLPVIVNAGQGDTDELVSRYEAGFVLRDDSQAEIARAGSALSMLCGDQLARRNARSLAEREYSLDDGARAYLSLYESISGIGRVSTS